MTTATAPAFAPNPASGPLTPHVRQVFATPRGRRFSRPGDGDAPTRDVPRLAHRSALAAHPAPPVAEKGEGPPPGRHRAPKPRHRRRRRVLGAALTLTCYTITAMTGALAHHLLSSILL